jgi:hypothetical protein
MKLLTHGAILAALACLAAPGHADDAPPPKRTTISLLAGGKEVGGLVFVPGKGQRRVNINALKQDWAPDGSLHASGHVELSLIMENATPITLYGDELTIRSDELDAEEARALDDLKEMTVSDQSIRVNPAHLSKEDWARQQVIDKANMARLAAIIKRYGWPGMRFAGAAYAGGAFMVLQHADAASQHAYLPLVRAAVARGDVPAADLALLEDRVLKSDGKPQLYGTQFSSEMPLKLYPVADEAHLDQRRREMGLPPMEVYLQQMRAIYQPN